MSEMYIGTRFEEEHTTHNTHQKIDDDDLLHISVIRELSSVTVQETTIYHECCYREEQSTSK